MFPIFLAPRTYDQDFEVLIRVFLQELVMFQRRAYKKNPLKQRRRLVFGFNECHKLLQIHNRVKMIIIARDVSIQSLQKNDYTSIRKLSATLNFPLIVGLTKKEMGAVMGTGRNSESSISTIINLDGALEKFHQITEKSWELKQKFMTQLDAEHFWHICAYGHLEALNEMKRNDLIRKRLNVEFANEGLTGLFASVKGLGNLDVIRTLIEEFHCDPSLVDFSLNSLLHLAVERSDIEIIPYLNSFLRRNIYWKKRNVHKRNVLLEAIFTCKSEIAEFFADKDFWNHEEQIEAMIASSRLTISGPLEALLRANFAVPDECIIEAAKHGSHNNIQLLVPTFQKSQKTNENNFQVLIRDAHDWAKRIDCQPMAKYLSKQIL